MVLIIPRDSRWHSLQKETIHSSLHNHSHPQSTAINYKFKTWIGLLFCLQTSYHMDIANTRPKWPKSQFGENQRFSTHISSLWSFLCEAGQWPGHDLTNPAPTITISLYYGGGKNISPTLKTLHHRPAVT